MMRTTVPLHTCALECPILSLFARLCNLLVMVLLLLLARQMWVCE